MGQLAPLVQLGAEWVDPGYSPFLTGAILLAGIGTTALFLVSVVAYLRRRTPRYLFVLVALAALLCRTVVGLGTMLGVVPMTIHHLVSHGLDFLVAAVILAAVYRSGPSGDALPADRSRDSGGDGSRQ